jgi:benzoyl-CoA reductase subunit BamC
MKKIIKEIKADIDKCTGCRACEMACSAFHAVPKYSSINPARSRIRVVVDQVKDVYVPIRGGEYTRAECNGRHIYTINGKEYGECSFCGASCPSRNYFKEPDSGLPLKCDMCENEPPLSEPMCVQACQPGCLTYVEWEEEVEEEDHSDGNHNHDDMEVGLESLVKKYGVQSVIDTVARLQRN